MYNRSAYNRSPYNTASGNFIWSSEVFAESSAAARVSVRMRLFGYAAAEGAAIGSLLRLLSLGGTAAAEGETTGIIFRTRNFTGHAEGVGTARATRLVRYGTEILSFDDLILQPGDQLVIDTEAMTVTLNGGNAVAYVADNAVFFNLSPGDNNLEFDGSGTADVRVVWKDRWL